MIILDTSVLVYAVGADHPFREPCLRLLSSAPTMRLTTTAGVIQEFVHVPDIAVGDALDLLVEHPGLGAFDAVLAATAARARCTALVATDGAFSGLRDCQIVVPDDEGVDRLLS